MERKSFLKKNCGEADNLKFDQRLPVNGYNILLTLFYPSFKILSHKKCCHKNHKNHKNKKIFDRAVDLHQLRFWRLFSARIFLTFCVMGIAHF